jgi:hypothetical protein
MSGIICRTKKGVAPDKNDKICFKNGKVLNGQEKNISNNKMPVKQEARKLLPSMLKDPNLKISFRKDNPKRPGSKAFDRYEKYKKATTLKKARELGAVREDFINDADRGFLKVIQEAKPPERLQKLQRKKQAGRTVDIRSSTPPRTPRRRISEGIPPGLPATNTASQNINRLALSTTGAVQQDATRTLQALNQIFTQPL